MRNQHEAMRSAISEMNQLLAAGDLGKFQTEWTAYKRALLVHAVMEDEGFFPLTDELFENASSNEHFREEHEDDHKRVEAVDAAVAISDTAAMQAAFAAWAAGHEAHLAHEEKILMPLTGKMAGTPADRAKVFADRMLCKGVATGDFDFCVTWVVQKLSKFGSKGNPPAVATRVWVHGLQHASTPDQWAAWKPLVVAACHGDVWTTMLAEVPDLDNAGKIQPSVVLLPAESAVAAGAAAPAAAAQ
jgi:hypothetical protein